MKYYANKKKVEVVRTASGVNITSFNCGRKQSKPWRPQRKINKSLFKNEN